MRLPFAAEMFWRILLRYAALVLKRRQDRFERFIRNNDDDGDKDTLKNIMSDDDNGSHDGCWTRAHLGAEVKDARVHLLGRCLKWGGGVVAKTSASFSSSSTADTSACGGEKGERGGIESRGGKADAATAKPLKKSRRLDGTPGWIVDAAALGSWLKTMFEEEEAYEKAAAADKEQEVSAKNDCVKTETITDKETGKELASQKKRSRFTRSSGGDSSEEPTTKKKSAPTLSATQAPTQASTQASTSSLTLALMKSSTSKLYFPGVDPRKLLELFPPGVLPLPLSPELLLGDNGGAWDADNDDGDYDSEGEENQGGPPPPKFQDWPTLSESRIKLSAAEEIALRDQVKLELQAALERALEKSGGGGVGPGSVMGAAAGTTSKERGAAMVVVSQSVVPVTRGRRSQGRGIHGKEKATSAVSETRRPEECLPAMLKPGAVVSAKCFRSARFYPGVVISVSRASEDVKPTSDPSLSSFSSSSTSPSTPFCSSSPPFSSSSLVNNFGTGDSTDPAAPSLEESAANKAIALAETATEEAHTARAATAAEAAASGTTTVEAEEGEDTSEALPVSSSNLSKAFVEENASSSSSLAALTARAAKLSKAATSAANKVMEVDRADKRGTVMSLSLDYVQQHSKVYSMHRRFSGLTSLICTRDGQLSLL